MSFVTRSLLPRLHRETTPDDPITFTGRGRDDDAIGAEGDDLLIGRGGDDRLAGNGGADRLRGGSGDDVLSGGGGRDRLVGGDGQDELEGGSSFDVLLGGAGADTLRGGSGDDILVGGAGDDLIDGGKGEDTLSYADAETGVVVDLAQGAATGDGSDTLSGIEVVRGSRHDDHLIGTGTGSVLIGGDGADLLQGGVDDFGDAARDVVSYRTSQEAVTVSLAERAGYTGDADGDTLLNIRILAGSQFDDIIRLSYGSDRYTSNGGADEVAGLDGDDRIYVFDQIGKIDGGLGDDTVVITGGENVVVESTMLDNVEIVVLGGGTIDLSAADTSSSRYVVSHETKDTVIVNGGAGSEQIFAEDGRFVFNAGAGDDALSAGTYAVFDGGDGFDTLTMTGVGPMFVEQTGVEKIVFTDLAFADLSSTDGSAQVGLMAKALGGLLRATRGDDTITIGDLGGLVDGGDGDDRITIGDGEVTIGVSTKDFGEDVITGFDVRTDRLDLSAAGILEDQVRLELTGDNVVRLVFEDLSGDTPVSGSMLFVGVDPGVMLADFSVTWG